MLFEINRLHIVDEHDAFKLTITISFTLLREYFKTHSQRVRSTLRGLDKNYVVSYSDICLLISQHHYERGLMMMI